MRSFRPSVILATSLALMPLAGIASAGQARPRSAPPAQGSSSSGSSSSSSSSSGEQGRSRTQAQPREREAAPPPQQQQSQRPEQTRERQTQRETPRETQRETPRAQPQYERPQYERPQQQQQDSRRDDNSRQAVPAPRDRYIDLNRDGRNDNRDSRVLGPQDRRDLERRNDNYYGSGGRYDGRYDRYDSRYNNYSPYRYNGPRVIFAPRENVRFSRPWFSFRPLIRLPFGLTIGIAQAFPSWYRPYIVGRPGYVSPYMPYGGVTFDIEPRDAELWIDGEYIGRVSDYSYNDPPLTLVAGSHSVELRSRYGRPLAFDITVIPGQVIPYQGTLPYYR